MKCQVINCSSGYIRYTIICNIFSRYKVKCKTVMNGKRKNFRLLRNINNINTRKNISINEILKKSKKKNDKNYYNR